MSNRSLRLVVRSIQVTVQENATVDIIAEKVVKFLINMNAEGPICFVRMVPVFRNTFI